MKSQNLTIGALNESPLHFALKQRYAHSEDNLEVAVDGWVADIMQDGGLIEIQTRNFSAIKRKLFHLVQHYPVRLVHPITSEKWILKPSENQDGTYARRKSPKKGGWLDIFDELAAFPDLLKHNNFSLELLLILEEEILKPDDSRGWRRKGWVTDERRLLQVIDRWVLHEPSALMELIPTNLHEPFTTRELAGSTGRNRAFAQKMAYCLREAGIIAQIGKRGRARLYIRSSSKTSPY